MTKIYTAWSRLFPNPGFYGWTIVGIGFICCALSSLGQSFALSLYLEHLIADLGLSRLALSSLYATATLLAAACLPLVGGWADQLSGRRFLTAVLVLMGMVLLLFAQVESVLALGAAFFALRLLGQGAVGLGTLTVTVRWFRRYRGRALAVVALGYAFGELIFPGVIYSSIERLGWRGSLAGFGAVYLLVFAPLVAWFSRERTEADGPSDGAPAGDSRLVLARDGGPASEPEQSFTLAEALRRPVFWALLLCVSVSPLVLTAVIFHQVALFKSMGWGVSLVPPAFMAFALGAAAMTYATGFLLERLPSQAGVSLSLALVSLALLTPAFRLPGETAAIAYGGLLGLSAGASKTANSIVWPDYFGIEALGAVKGVVNAARNGATALGPPLAAVLIGGGDSFALALVAFGGTSAAAACAAGLLRPPTRGDDDERKGQARILATEPGSGGDTPAG